MTSKAVRALGTCLAALILTTALRAIDQTPTPTPDPVAVPSSAVVSPDGRRAAWASDDGRSVWNATRSSAGAAWSAPSRLLTIRGTARHLVFSPDNRRLAFENPRSGITAPGAPQSPPASGTWGFIAVCDLATRRISYVDPVFAWDTEPAWSADSRQISFLRSVGELAGARMTRRAPEFGTWTPPPANASESFSLASALATPFVYTPSASGDGRSIAYASREGVNRNIYYWRMAGISTDSPAEAARQIVNFAGDDGKELTDVALSWKGGAVAFVRGAATNPASLPDPPEPEIWIVGVSKNDKPRLMGAGTAPRFSEDEQRLMWTSPTRATMAAALTWNRDRLVSVGAPQTATAPAADVPGGGRGGGRGGGQDAGLPSPSGSLVAYRRATGIEIAQRAGGDFAVAGKIVPNSTGVDTLLWSRDSRYVAFRKSSVGTTGSGGIGGYRFNGAPVASQPWSLWVVDVQTSESRQLFQAKQGMGSMPGGSLFWSDDNRVAFQWEGDGWQHYYSVPAAGGAPTLITRGDGDVEAADVSLDRKHLIITSNIGDLGRRHISVVDFRGGTIAIIRQGSASQWAPVQLADGKLAYLEAGYATPPAVMIRDRDGRTIATGLPAIAPASAATKFVEPMLVEFPAIDGTTAFGQLFVPAQPKGCGVIFAHGGIRRQMLPGFHYMDAYTHLYEMNQYLVSRGCVVLSVEYRSSIMRGYAFRNAAGWGYAGASEMLDVAGGAKYLLARADVDAARGVGVFGLSWGGYITAQALAQYPDLFSVGFDMAGVHTAPSPEGVPYSAMAFIDKWTRPIFLAQGDDDRNVNLSEGIKLAVALQTKRPNVEFMQRVVPGETHDLYLTFEHLVGVYTQGSQFLLSHLGIK